MATDPQQLLMALAGSTGLGQQIADNAQNQQIQQTLGQQQIQQGQYLQQQQADQASAAQQFQRDVLDYNQDPTPQKLSALAMRYPQQAQNFTAAAKLKDDAQRNADLTSYGQIYAAANNGRSDLVLQQLQQRQQAMRAAGQDTSNIDDAIQQLNAGGDDALKNVKSIALAQIYSHDPDGFSKAFNLGDDGNADAKVVGKSIGHYEGNKFVLDYRDPDAGTGGGGQASTTGGAGDGSAGSARRFGWTPRGPNSDAAVDGKIAGMTKALGVGADAPLPANASNLQIAQALSLSEGGAGSLADRNNNPANLTDPKTGAYRKFPTKEAGLQAAAAQVARNRARGQNTIRSMVEGLPVGGSSAGVAPATPGQPAMIAGIAPKALDNAAYVYNRTGKFPTGLGRGGEAQKAIINRAAELAGSQDPSQILTGQAQLKADTGSLNTLERNTGNVLAFERTALRNGALAVRKATAVDNGGVPIFNKWVNAGRQATGDPAISGFNAAVETFANEFAKVTTSATGGGVTSDSAREHARQLINTAQTPDQFFEVMRTLQTDMANRRSGLETERQAILNRISGKPLHTAPSGIPAGFRVLNVRPK